MKTDAHLALGVGGSGDGLAGAVNLQLNRRSAGWAARMGLVAGSSFGGGSGATAYAGAGALGSGEFASGWLSYTLYAGLDVGHTVRNQSYNCVSDLTTADNWPIGGQESCDTRTTKGIGLGPGLGASLNVHLGSFLLGLQSNAQLLASTVPAASAVLALQLGVGFD